MGFLQDLTAIRRRFPILSDQVHGKPLVYLDNAATTQKPQVVIDRVGRYYAAENANIHRGVHALSERATDAYESARETVRRFVNAATSREIVSVRGATEAINLVAQTYGRLHLGRDDEIVISSVTFERTCYGSLPHKFEAGTPNVAGAVGLAAAIDFLTAVGMDRISAHEHALLAYATDRLSQIPGLRFTGTARDRTAILSFLLDDVHPHDIATIVDRAGVAIRAGHHCCQPLMARLGVAATARASLALYNCAEEVDILAAALRQVGDILA